MHGKVSCIVVHNVLNVRLSVIQLTISLFRVSRLGAPDVPPRLHTCLASMQSSRFAALRHQVKMEMRRIRRGSRGFPWPSRRAASRTTVVTIFTSSRGDPVKCNYFRSKLHACMRIEPLPYAPGSPSNIATDHSTFPNQGPNRRQCRWQPFQRTFSGLIQDNE